MNKVLVNKQKHKFSEIAAWLVANMPKDDVTEDRWHFEETEEDATSNGMLLSRITTYLIFKDDQDAMLFTLRWS